jgi:hypothetical protein
VSDTATLPTEGRCDRCKQTRPLFRYEPAHSMHLGGGAFNCRWCNRAKQPDLCVRCWGVERAEEENDPALNEEAEMLAGICATNSAWAARRERDKATVAGIAAVSGMGGAS